MHVPILRLNIHCYWWAHGLRTPRESFFLNPELLGMGRHFGLKVFEAFGVFSAGLSAPILLLWVPFPCFLLFNHYFYKKLSLYIHIPNIYLGLGFEFGPKRIIGIQPSCVRSPWHNISQSFGTQSSGLSNWKVWRDLRRYNNIFTRHSQNTEKKCQNTNGTKEEYRLFFLRSIAQFFTQIYMNCFVSS